jgi:hypothetical protein
MNPTQLLTDLWDAQYGVTYPPHIVQRFWQRDLTIARTHCAAMFSGDSEDSAKLALLSLIEGISDGKGRAEDVNSSYVPRAWFHLFHTYFRSRLISSAVWGCAARILYIVSPPGPGDALPAFRALPAMHLMRPNEYEIWRLRPAVVTAYRGTCASCDSAMWRGVSWTCDPDQAVAYAHIRTMERYDTGDLSGWPRLVEAKVPSALVLAVVQDGRELLIDHDQMRPEMVRELAPVPPGQVATHIERLAAQCAAPRPTRAAVGADGFLTA